MHCPHRTFLILRSIPAEKSSGISGAGGSVQASASIQASAAAYVSPAGASAPCARASEPAQLRAPCQEYYLGSRHISHSGYTVLNILRLRISLWGSESQRGGGAGR